MARDYVKDLQAVNDLNEMDFVIVKIYLKLLMGFKQI